MLEKVLSQIGLIVHKVEGHRKKPNPHIRTAIMESYTLDNRMSENPAEPSYYDYKLEWTPWCQNINDFVRLEFHRGKNRNFVLNNYWGNVYFPQQSSLNRNQVISNSLKSSPDYTCVFCVEAQKDSCNLVFEYDDNRRTGATWTIPMETDVYVIIPSTLRYYISQNNGGKPNFFFTMTATNA